MDRSRRKRKLTEKLRNSFVELPELQQQQQQQLPEIKQEPTELDEENNVFCRLCKATSGVRLLALFGGGRKGRALKDAVLKIRTCLGIEISPEQDPEATICRVCVDKLDRYDAFRSRALQCNDYALNQMAADEAELEDAPTEIRVCRFCLKIGGRLIDLYPEGENSEEQQLAKIRECLDVEVNLWDAVTKICRVCAQSLDELVAFRKEMLPESVYVKQEENPQSSSSGSGEVESLDVALDMNVSDSDCSMEEGADPLVVAGKTTLKSIQPELVELLGTDQEGRNFTVIQDVGENLKVTFDGFQFIFASMEPKGSSRWKCVQSSIRVCRVKLEIDSLGMVASLVGPTEKHNHSAGPSKLLECPVGKGKMPFNGVETEFWLYNGYFKKNPTARTIFLEGFKYYLKHMLHRSTGSVWDCCYRKDKSCKATLLIEGIFEKAVLRGKHTHPAITQRKFDTALSKAGIDLESTDEAITAFRRDNPPSAVEEVKDREEVPPNDTKRLLAAIRSSVKEKQPEIFRVLEQEDSGRNFEVTRAGAKFKICAEGYEYRYCGRLESGVTVWKCIMDSVKHCLVVVQVSVDGKRMEPFKGNHSHGTEPLLEVLSYPIGKRMVGGEAVWLLIRVSLYYESRFVLFRGFLYILQEINGKGVIRWCCMRKHSCRTLLLTKGDFVELVQKGEHSHEPLSDDEISKLTDTKPSAVPGSTENLSFRQKLYSYQGTTGQIWDEDRNQYETFYILSDINKACNAGYGFVFRGHRYAFGSLDKKESSQWKCLWHWQASKIKCNAKALIEGLFQSVRIAKSHNHEEMPEAELQHMLKRSVQHPAHGESTLETLSEPQSSNILAILARPDPERNFEVKRTKYKIVITYEGVDFRLKSRKPDGSSEWSCVWMSARKCKVSLNLTSDGKKVTFNPDKKHSHSDDDITVFSHELGQLQIYDEDQDNHQPCYLYSYQSEYRENRGIVYQGYKYLLHNINHAGVSTWKCLIHRCLIIAKITDIMKIISIKGTHKHVPLTTDQIKSLTGTIETIPNLSPLLSTPSNEATPLRYPTLQRILSTADPDRNFKTLIHQDQMKIAHNNYEYVYSSSTATHTHWKCVFTTIRKCRAKLTLDNAGKTAHLPEFPKHNHHPELWELFYYPQGKSTIMNAYTEVTHPFYFFVQQTFLKPIPFLIYERHKYTIRFITESGDSCKWQCVGNGCRTCLTVTGLFELLVEDGSVHVDAPLSAERQAEIIRKHGGEVSEGGDESEDDIIPFVEVQMKEWYGDGVIEL